MKIPLRPVINDIFFIFGAGVVLMLDFSLLRALLFFRNRDLAVAVPLEEIGRAFEIGLRFDLIVTSFCLMPVALMILMPWSLGRRRWAIGWLALVGFVANFAGVLELDFYNQFHTRLNSLVFQYLKEDPKTVISMLYYGFPLIRYLLLFAGLWAIYLLGIFIVDRLTRVEGRFGLGRPHPLLRLVAVCMLAVVLIFGARGTFRHGPPLRWGDAFHSRHLFANHLALNGLYTLAKAAATNCSRKNERYWMEAMDQDEAVRITRQMVLTRYDRPIEEPGMPLLRLTTPPGHHDATGIENVVVIIMESFSAQFIGALGSRAGITPEFDALSGKGLLFTRFFSNGTHTHQGMFATLASFPNLPGFEYLMQQPEGSHQFSGLPVLLKPLGYSDIYLYNGDFSWDNQEGFFRNQGMTRFIGRYDYVHPKVADPTWGVSDEDMFDRALEELVELCVQDKPFFAVLQTLSNHTPYPLPKRLPVEPVTGFGELNEHLTAMRYSDWALGRFFRKVESNPCFSKTLFVILGDHGFGLPEQVSSMDLLRFHIPLLLIGPGIRKEFGAISQKVGSQVDIVPTIMGLLGRPYVNQCWGRDLLALDEDDPGFCVIKPSGSEQTVALIRGDAILVKAPEQPLELGRYELMPEPAFQPVDDDALRQEMDRQLSAYIQTAMRALKENRTGVPKSSDSSVSSRP